MSYRPVISCDMCKEQMIMHNPFDQYNCYVCNDGMNFCNLCIRKIKKRKDRFLVFGFCKKCTEKGLATEKSLTYYVS